jgi:hypothetical protein
VYAMKIALISSNKDVNVVLPKRDDSNDDSPTKFMVHWGSGAQECGGLM